MCLSSVRIIYDEGLHPIIRHAKGNLIFLYSAGTKAAQCVKCISFHFISLHYHAAKHFTMHYILRIIESFKPVQELSRKAEDVLLQLGISPVNSVNQ